MTSSSTTNVVLLSPPGVLNALMDHVDIIAEYHRDGNLYLSDFTMSDFVRQGQNA